MPAPAPIRIRYGQAGLLGQAVAEAATGERQSRQAAADMALISQMLDHSNRLKEMEFASELDANKLQAAYALHRSRQQPADEQQPLYYAGPNAASSDPASVYKNALLAQSGVDAETEPSLRQALNNPKITPEQAHNLITTARNRKAQTEKEQKLAKSKESKQKFYDTLDADAKAHVGPYLDDDNMTLSQMRIAAKDLAMQKTATARVDAFNEGQIRQAKVRQLAGDMSTISKQMQKDFKINPEIATPASFNPQYADRSDDSPFGAMGVFGAVRDLPFVPGSGSLVKGKDLATNKAWAAYVEYLQKKQQLQTILNSDGSKTPVSAPTPEQAARGEAPIDTTQISDAALKEAMISELLR